MIGGMYGIFEISPQRIYVAFPNIAKQTSVPFEVQEWLRENVGNNIEWGMADHRRVGVYLSEQDATAFRLRFGI